MISHTQPEITAQIARQSFPKGNIYMKMRSEIGVLYKDESFATLYISTFKNGAGLKPIEFARGFMSFLIKACPIFYGKSLTVQIVVRVGYQQGNWR